MNDLQGMSVTIAGGGLGGLSAALALCGEGAEVNVLEQQQHIRPIGYGIQIGPNVFKAFDRFDLRDSVLEKAFLPKSIAMIDARDGSDIARIPVNDAEHLQRFAPYIAIHREDFHAVMLAACRDHAGITLRENCRVLDYEHKDDKVFVSCEGHQVFSSDVFLGADGLGSVVRKSMLNDKPHPIGYVAHRTIIPMKDVPQTLHRYMDDIVLWAGPHCHIVHYPLRDRSEFNVVVVFQSKLEESERGTDAFRDEVARIYGGLHQDIQSLINLMDYSRRWVISDLRPVRNWSHGRVALLGDAAHATLQTLAQGAGMAIEDAPVLAEALVAHHDNIPVALATYARQRMLRTERVQLTSRHMWPEYHVADPIEIEARRARFAKMGREEFYYCMQWLWSPENASKPSGV